MSFRSLFSKLRKTLTTTAEKIKQISSISIRNKSDHNNAQKKRNRISIRNTRGIDVLRNPATNKGTAFTLKERQLMGIHGLVPPSVRTIEEQIIRVLTNIDNCIHDLDKYVYLIGLLDRNEKLFYKVVCENVERLMPILYTPTVGIACQHYGVVFQRPRGIFISIKDKGHIYEILCNWPEKSVKAIVVTDGERILGLGDLGAYGMGIPVGKLSLYTALAGIQPSVCLPVLLDVGTNNQKLHNDAMYIGLNKIRVTGPKYDAFIDEFMHAVVERYGPNCLVQFEDFGNQNAFRFLKMYRDKYCMFNDDIQGTASMATAGIFASLRITKKKLSDNKFLFLGAGEAALGIANLLCWAMEEEGTSKQEAQSHIWLMDSKGLITKGRPSGVVSKEKLFYAKDFKHLTNLEEVVEELKPTAIIGAAAVPGAFTENVIRSMAKHNERPVIFALSNPTSMSECTAEQAYTLTDGRCVFASGSPFPAVNFNGKTFYPGQGNNAYIFPGVALAIITCEVKHIPDTIFLRAARCLSQLVTDGHLEEGRLYPPLSQIQNVSFRIAVSISEFVYEKGLASAYPEPANKEDYLRSFMYDTSYDCFEPSTWKWADD